MAHTVQPTIAAALDAQGRGAKSRLARALGVKPQSVTRWVSGETVPPPERWLAIEDALDLARFDLARAAGLYDSLDLGSVDEATAEARWAATFPTSTRPRLPGWLSSRLRERIAERLPELDALPARSPERVAAYEMLGAVTDGVADALAEVIEGPMLDRAADEAAVRVREAIGQGAVETADYDELIARAVEGDFALAAERGAVDHLDDPDDARGGSSRPQPPPVDPDIT